MAQKSCEQNSGNFEKVFKRLSGVYAKEMHQSIDWL